MNRTLTIVLAIFVAALIIVVAALVVREQNLPPAAQAALDKYIEYRYPPPEVPLIRQIARASLSWNFSPNLSGATFGDNAHFRTTLNYRAQPVINLLGAPTVTPSLWTLPSSDDRPLIPFPPVEVWCVLLRDKNQSAQPVVYVALHQDLYYTNWLLHEAASGSKEEMADALSKIGCNLKLGAEE